MYSKSPPQAEVRLYLKTALKRTRNETHRSTSQCVISNTYQFSKASVSGLKTAGEGFYKNTRFRIDDGQWGVIPAGSLNSCKGKLQMASEHT